MADENNNGAPAPDDSGPVTPQTPPPPPGTPQGGDQLDQAAAQVYQQHQAVFNQPLKPVTPPASPSRPTGFGQKLSAFYQRLKDTNPLPSMAETAGKLGTAMERGAVDAGAGVANTAIDIGNAVEGAGVKAAKAITGDPTAGDNFDKWYHSGDGTPPPSASSDAMFGKKQGGVYDFVENATAFTAAYEAGSEAAGVTGIKPGAVKTLVKAGLVGLAQAAATDPRAARISDMIENGAPSLSNPLTQFLKSNGTDSDALGRLKNGLEGSMTGFAIDKFLGVLGGIVKDIATNGAAGAATPAADEAIQAAANAKPDPVTAVATPDGGATIVHNPAATPMRTLFRVEPSTLADQSAEAEAAARNALGPEYYAQVESEKGRLFSDVPREDYGHGKPDHTTYSVQVPESEAESYARDHGTLGKEYLLPQEIADTKTPLGADGNPVPAATGPVQSGLMFDSMADAESHAAAINENVATSAIPTGHVDDADIADLISAMKNAPKGTKISAVIPKGAFNYNYFGGDASTQAVMETLATKLRDGLTGLRNVVGGVGENGAELTAKAMQMVQQDDAGSWLGRSEKNSDALARMTYEQMASKIMLKQMAVKMSQLSQAVDINPSNLLATSNMKALGDQMLHLFGETASADSGGGRFLQSMKNEIPDVAEDGTVTAPASNPLTKDFTPKDWGELARQVRLSGGDASLIMDSMVSKVGQVVARNDPSKMDLFNAFRANMMLSGPKTSIVLATSQALAAFQAPVEYWMGGLLKNDTALRQQGADMLTGMWTNLGAAWKVAAEAWKAGEPILDSHTGVAQDTGQANAVGGPMGWLGTIMKVPTRVIMTVDEFYKNLNYLNSVRGLSLRASAEDLKNMPPMSLAEEAQYRAGHLADDLRTSVDPNGKALNPVALSYSRDATFQTPLTGFGATLQNAAQEHPWLRLIAPYIRTPVNLARYAWQRTPVLGALAGDMRADIAAGGTRQAVALGKQTAGAAVWGSAAMMVASGNMTGAGPTDPELRKQWVNAGNQPYSVRIPGTNEWISYRRIDQLGTPLSMVADIAEMSGHLRETDTQNVFMKFIAGISADLTSKTFLGGIANFFDAAHSGDPKKWQQLSESLAGSVIPAALRQSDPDPRYHEVRGMIDALAERVPGWSSTLESKRNILGEPVMKPPGYFNANMNPFTLSPGSRVDPIQDQLVQLGHGMSMPDDHINALDLTDRKMWKNSDPAHANQSPYDRMLQLMAQPKDGGDNLRKALTDEINSDDWKQAGTDERALIASKIIKGYQKDAMDQMQPEYKGLSEAIEQAKGIQKQKLDNGPGVNAPTPWTGTGNRIPATSSASPAFIQ